VISIAEARALLQAHAPALPAEFVALDRCHGALLAADAYAADDYPRMDASAVDGYAIAGGEGPWRVVASLPAGSAAAINLAPGTCARIFTGAQVPAGTYAVAMQEHALTTDGSVRLDGRTLRAGANIRRRGEGFRKGELLLAKGAYLGPAAVGLLASAGVHEVLIAKDPVLSIIRTGDEFVEPGIDPSGRIHSSNDHMLRAAANLAGIITADAALTAGDEPEDLKAALLAAASQGDAVISTGGVSVGDHDLMHRALSELGARIHFHGVNQKPGKPMLFATLDGIPVLALPGNPRAVLVAWHLYALPLIRMMQGAAQPWPPSESLPLASPCAIRTDRAELRAARVQHGRVHLLPEEGSHLLGTMALANAIACFPAAAREFKAGESVEVHYLPPQ
jgi:molybdopterin molybdotransferase